MKTPENFFRTLANRSILSLLPLLFCTEQHTVKGLEINQSLSTRYLEDLTLNLTSRYLNLFKELKENLERVQEEHVQLSKAIHAAATHGAAMVFLSFCISICDSF